MRRLSRAAGLLALAVLAAAAGPKPEVLDPRAAYPEGAYWTGAAALYSEMGEDALTQHDGAKPKTLWREAGCGPTAIAPYGEGWAVACHLGGYLALLDRAFAKTGQIGAGRDAAAPKGRALQALVGMPNDMSADGRGGVYFSNPGPFSKASRPSGLIVRLAPDGTVRAVAEGLWYPNGVHVDRAAGALFASEHLARRIWRFPILADGGLGAGEVFAEIDSITPPAKARPYAEAGPDGLELTASGDLVVALYGEGRLVQLTPAGALRREISVPFAYVTNIAFTAGGDAIVVGAYDNQPPGYPGAVLRLPAATFAVE